MQSSKNPADFRVDPGIMTGIVDCEVAICYGHANGLSSFNRSSRYQQARVAVAQSGQLKYLVVGNAKKELDKFRLTRGNVTVFKSSFGFKNPPCQVLLRSVSNPELERLRRLIFDMLQPNAPPPPVPALENIMKSMDPPPQNATITGTKLTAKQYKLLDNLALKKVDIELEIISAPHLNGILGKIVRLAMLSELHMTGCKLRTVPYQLRELKCLRHLDLSCNEIKEIPMWFCQDMQHLRFLNMSKNILLAVPFEFYLLKNCNVLDFSDNKICSLPNSLFFKILGNQRLPYERINFRGNNIRYMPPLPMLDLQGLMDSFLRISNVLLLDDKFDQNFNTCKEKLLQPGTNSLAISCLEMLTRKEITMAKLFDSQLTVKPIYDDLQRILYICSDCRKTKIRFGCMILSRIYYPLRFGTIIISHAQHNDQVNEFCKVLCPSCERKTSVRRR